MSLIHAEQLGGPSPAVRPMAPVAQTWTELRAARDSLQRLWETLFHQLAADAGLPPPDDAHLGIASYAKKAHAEVLAAHALKALGRTAGRFMVKTTKGPRHCVSLS